MSDLETIRDGWDAAAREDAMGNIVTIPGLTEKEFWLRGRQEIDEMLDHLDELGLKTPRVSALDFGCGVGRLTQALGLRFGIVLGVDISGEMIDRAHELNRSTRHNVAYRQTGASLLETFPTDRFDLIYSRITLQHMPAELQRGYVGEFVELLNPNGLAVFQIPEGPDYQHPNEWLSMYGVSRETVEGWVNDLEARLLDVELLDDGGSAWLAYRYTVAP